MSWRGSTGHIDANVPDYQKMLQTGFPSTGWSSTQAGFSAYSGRSGRSPLGGGYLNSHSSSPTYGKSSRTYGAMYQPSKYGLAADSTYHSSIDLHRGQGQTEEGVFRSDNGYKDKNYGALRDGNDPEPLQRDYLHATGQGRGHARRMVDYSSDSGPTNNHASGYLTGYSSDSGGGRGHVLDYTSDNGPSNLSHRKKSSEFELEIPSPVRSFKKEDMEFNSPVNSHMLLSDFFSYSDNQSSYTENQSQQALSDYLRDSQSHNNQTRNIHKDTEDGSSPHGNYGNHEDDHVSNVEANEDKLLSFKSPPLYRGSIGDTNFAHTTTKPPKSKTGNLTRWQQGHLFSSTDNDMTNLHSTNHQHTHDSLHRHRKEKHQHSSHVSKPHPSDQSNMPIPSDHSNMSSLQPNLSEQINHIRSAADHIIRDKDAIIEQLRNQVVTLQEAVKEYENKLRRTVITRGANSGESASFSKMQDLEYRNSELRSELAKLKLTKDTEIEDLEIKLGGVEHEVVQLKSALRKAQPNAADMKEKLDQKQHEIQEWQTKYSRANKSYEDMKEKLDGLERYLSDLPTMEEFNKTSSQLSKCQEEVSLKTDQIEELEERLKQTTEQISDRDITIQDLRGRQRQMANKLHELSKEMKRLKTEGEGKALNDALEELAETKEMKERLALDLEKAKKFLEMNHRRLSQLEVKHQTDKQQIQERLVQEEESGTALREEIRLKEEQIFKLKDRLKNSPEHKVLKYAGKNQDLMDEGLILKEQMRQQEQMSTDENQNLQRKFVKEMGVCFAELQSLVQICIQLAEGKDPNISLLLGMRDSVLDDEEEEGAAGGSKREEQSIKHWFKKLKELQVEVVKVRKTICNKVAEDMGANLNCATQ